MVCGSHDFFPFFLLRGALTLRLGWNLRGIPKFSQSILYGRNVTVHPDCSRIHIQTTVKLLQGNYILCYDPKLATDYIESIHLREQLFKYFLRLKVKKHNPRSTWLNIPSTHYSPPFPVPLPPPGHPSITSPHAPHPHTLILCIVTLILTLMTHSSLSAYAHSLHTSIPTPFTPPHTHTPHHGHALACCTLKIFFA